jgi:hypothetical protein
MIMAVYSPTNPAPGPIDLLDSGFSTLFSGVGPEVSAQPVIPVYEEPYGTDEWKFQQARKLAASRAPIVTPTPAPALVEPAPTIGSRGPIEGATPDDIAKAKLDAIAGMESVLGKSGGIIPPVAQPIAAPSASSSIAGKEDPYSTDAMQRFTVAMNDAATKIMADIQGRLGVNLQAPPTYTEGAASTDAEREFMRLYGTPSWGGRAYRDSSELLAEHPNLIPQFQAIFDKHVAKHTSQYQRELGLYNNAVSMFNAGMKMVEDQFKPITGQAGAMITRPGAAPIQVPNAPIQIAQGANALVNGQIIPTEKPPVSMPAYGGVLDPNTMKVIPTPPPAVGKPNPTQMKEFAIMINKTFAEEGLMNIESAHAKAEALRAKGIKDKDFSKIDKKTGQPLMTPHELFMEKKYADTYNAADNTKMQKDIFDNPLLYLPKERHGVYQAAMREALGVRPGGAEAVPTVAAAPAASIKPPMLKDTATARWELQPDGITWKLINASTRKIEVVPGQPNNYRP